MTRKELIYLVHWIVILGIWFYLMTYFRDARLILHYDLPTGLAILVYLHFANKIWKFNQKKGE